MPQLSIVIPVYDVQDYLPACLDSILGSGEPDSGDLAGGGPAGLDLEVIAVDDASPDGCGAILDQRASTDSRLTVVHLDRNGGQGNARNLALSRASGDYVWFVDGDDALAVGALTAAAKSLAESTPDVLLIDWVSCYPGDRTEPNPGARLLASVPAAGCTLEQQPELINLTMTSWSKLFRRDFLLGLDVGFGSGIHEDIQVTCAALLAAGVIGAVDQVCYQYRRERRGSAMATTSHRQFAVFAAYESVFALLDRRAASGQPVSPRLRAAIFERAIWHYTTVLQTTGPGIGRIGLPGLVPRSERHAFFRRMHQDFVRYEPESYQHPAGPRGAKLRLIEHNRYWTYAVLEPVNQARVAVRRATRRGR
jgi:CDP-glycerol glycerophosphotransferase